MRELWWFKNPKTAKTGQLHIPVWLIYPVRNLKKTGVIWESWLCTGFEFRLIYDVFLASHKIVGRSTLVGSQKRVLRATVTQSNLLSFTFLSYLFKTLDASHLLIFTIVDGVLRLAGRPRTHRRCSHPDGVPPGWEIRRSLLICL
jgi:hypothetical protein